MGELRDARALGATLVAAVGPATADALRRPGVEPDLVPAEHRAAGLVAEFPDYEPGSPGNLVLFPCAELAPSDHSRGVGGQGLGGPTRRGLPDGCAAATRRWLLDRMAHADAVIFAASSSAAAYAALKGPDGASAACAAAGDLHRTDHGRATHAPSACPA